MEDKVIKIIANILKEDVTIDSTAFNCYNWDSLGHLEILVDVESEFNIKFNTKLIPELTSVKRIIEKLEELV